VETLKYLLIFLNNIFLGRFVHGLENSEEAILVKFSTETADKPKEGIHIFESS